MAARAFLAIAVVTLLAGAAAAAEPAVFDQPTRAFLSQLDNRQLAALAVQYSGRTTILDTLARQELSTLYGQPSVDGVPPAASYLELYINAGRYFDSPIVYVRSRRLRPLLAVALTGSARDELLSDHRLPPSALVGDMARAVLIAAGRGDTGMSATQPSLAPALQSLAEQPANRLLLDQLETALAAFLSWGRLAILPLPHQPWQAPDAMKLAAVMGKPASSEATAGWHGQREAMAMETAQFDALADAWKRRDAAAVNAAAATLTSAGQAAVGQDYPSALRRQAELLYNSAWRLSWPLIAAAAALVIGIFAASTASRLARAGTVVLLAIATGLLLLGFIVRWSISGRAWYLPPLMNQYEAVTASAWLAGLLAIALHRRTGGSYLLLAAALYITAALLASILFPEQMSPSISAPAGILASPIMSAHVAVIIIGHAVAGIAALLSLLYLATAFVGLARSDDALNRCILLTARLAVWTLAAGTILGAVWADRAWGRWWGWDPKETWALITTLLFVAAFHAPLAVKPHRRGLALAIGCLLGGAAMAFNWIVVNYLLAGLHSYA